MAGLVLLEQIKKYKLMTLSVIFSTKKINNDFIENLVLRSGLNDLLYIIL